MQTSWLAIYIDGTTLQQYNADGSENKYLNIERDKLKQFVLLRDNEPKVVIHVDQNKKLIYRMRTAANNKGIIERVYLAGWQQRTNGMNTQMISFLFEDGHIEIVDKFRENHPWFYSVNFIAEERL
jgi:hypothetical protein